MDGRPDHEHATDATENGDGPCESCGDLAVARIYVRAARADLCRCTACGLEWDEPVRLHHATLSSG